MARKNTLLEGSLVVEMKSGEHRIVTCSPFGGHVYHQDPREAFGETTATPEDEFRATMRRVVSRSRYDSR